MCWRSQRHVTAWIAGLFGRAVAKVPGGTARGGTEVQVVCDGDGTRNHIDKRLAIWRHSQCPGTRPLIEKLR